MQPVVFETVVVTRDDGHILIVPFDGAGEPVPLILLTCSVEAARALSEGLAAALADDGSDKTGS